MHSSFIRYTFASGKRFSFIAGLCTVLCFMLWGGAAQAQLTDQMRTQLAAGTGVIPQDYTLTDSSVITAGNNPNIPDPDGRGADTDVGVVDWVEVQIRVIDNTVTQPPTGQLGAPVADASYIKAAWLLSDGSVVDVDSDINAINTDANVTGELTIPTDDTGLTFDASDQHLYVLINHRNHLPIMSASAVSANTESVYNYDFTENAAQAVGGGSALKEASGVLSMIVGDTGRDGGVGGADISSDILPNIGNATYHIGDVTLDVNVGGADTAQAQANIGAASQISY